MLALPRIRPLSEQHDIDFVIETAGGRRAHPDSDRRRERNSDYVLGNSIIELKLLEEERLDKPEAQNKIASLFGRSNPERPVIVIDPTSLSKQDYLEYSAIMRAPIKQAVKSASGQLKLTRGEQNPGASTVLFVVNNGLSTMGHDELVDHVVGRAKNDSSNIDAVVVAGCYLHGDGFDTFAIWPIDCISIHDERQFGEFELLRDAWSRLANRHMTEFVQGKHGQDASKEAQTDLTFEHEGITYVKPAPPLGVSSEYFGDRRPRLNELRYEDVGSIAVTIPRISPAEYRRIEPALEGEPLLSSLETWKEHISEAMRSSVPHKPVVAVDVTRGGWEAWKRKNPNVTGLWSLRLTANALYGAQATRQFRAAKNIIDIEKLPREFVWVELEVIGQDAKNDIAHIGYFINGDEKVLASNLRLRHNEALALAAAHAIKLGIKQIIWKQDLRYAWT